MENQHPLDAAPELAEAVTAEAVAEPTLATSDVGEQSKARHPRTLVARLAEAYPTAFSLDGRKVRPLAVGILKELQAAREGEGGHGLSMQELRRALRYYTQGAAYHRAVARGDARVNLAGEAVGEVSEDQKAHAEARLAELAPKLPKRPERPVRKAGEGEGGEAPAERPRRPRKPASARGEARAEGKGEGRKPRREAGAPRPARAERPARREEPSAPVLSAEEKLNLLLEKFGSK
ncbi:ProQ/FINO family protein [Thiofaba sp. EF100]|uniref:ProQ/FINO family protein n=1 Tax=Thiofaba sp. EF100 TaxID=3121274 RepID=UPI0032219AD4